jgi:hypothetical protein
MRMSTGVDAENGDINDNLITSGPLLMLSSAHYFQHLVNLKYSNQRMEDLMFVS